MRVLKYCFNFVIIMKQTIVNKLKTFFPAYPVEKAWIFGKNGKEANSDIEWKAIC